MKIELAVVHAKNTQKTHIVYAPSINIETTPQKNTYKNDTADM